MREDNVQPVDDARRCKARGLNLDRRPLDAASAAFDKKDYKAFLQAATLAVHAMDPRLYPTWQGKKPFQSIPAVERSAIFRGR